MSIILIAAQFSRITAINASCARQDCEPFLKNPCIQSPGGSMTDPMRGTG
jgi:hypothetical protein